MGQAFWLRDQVLDGLVKRACARLPFGYSQIGKATDFDSVIVGSNPSSSFTIYCSKFSWV